MLASGVLQSDLVIHIHIPACSAGDPGSIPGLGRSPGEGNGNLLQYSCLENAMSSMKRQKDMTPEDKAPR